VRAAHHRGEGVVPSGPAAENVAHLIDGDLAVDLFEPLHEQIARLLVLVAQRQALDAAARSAADFRHLFQGGLQPLAVHTQCFQIHLYPPTLISGCHVDSSSEKAS